MKKAEWNMTYINELLLFPKSKYKDQVDASSGAFTCLTFSGGRIGVW
jgi:phage terminase large subunit-like protein